MPGRRESQGLPLDRSSDRRTLLKAAAVGASLAVARPAARAEALGAGDRLRLGLIGCGNRMKALVGALLKLRAEGANLDVVAYSEVYRGFADAMRSRIVEATGVAPTFYEDHRDLVGDKNVDAVVIATPDHWHARQSLDALAAGKHVYCEKPMTHSIDDALRVADAWRASGLVMQVGVQSTSLPVWDLVRRQIDDGRLGKVLQFQTEYFRNSNTGQTRFHALTEDMSPQTVNWRRWLGVAEGLAAERPFDRAVFRHWRCYWPFGAGMLTDLFVHRLTAMLLATGLRYPGRVCAGGGIFLEYDDRDTPDTTTVVVDYREGVQGVVSATMCSEAVRLPHAIRGHFGSFVFPGSENLSQFDFVPERPQVTLDSSLKPETITVEPIADTTLAHVRNFVEAARAGRPEQCRNTPELGAAAVVTIQLGKRSYREGKVFYFDAEKRRVVEGDASWADAWERMSKARATPRQVPGWHAGDRGSTLKPPEYMKLAGPWIDDVPPERRS